MLGELIWPHPQNGLVETLEAVMRKILLFLILILLLGSCDALLDLLDSTDSDEGSEESIWSSGKGAPSVSVGKEGDLYLDTHTGDVYIRETTAWVFLASLGELANDTATGTQWHTGTSEPSSTTGENGDLYLNTTTGEVYEKVSGVWSSVQRLQGPQGEPGPPGPAGTSEGDEGVWEGSLFVLSEADLVLLEGYHSITGTLLILDIGIPTSITNLDSLSSLTSIGGNLRISLDTLTDISGLSGLTSVGGLYIGSNSSLNSAALSSLTSVEGDLQINWNRSLINLDLGSLTSVGGNLVIDDTTALVFLDLGSLTSVGVDLVFENNTVLTDLGLGALTSVGGNLVIWNNDALAGLGLSALSSIGGYLHIRENAALISLGLGSVISVGGDFIVTGNPSLAATDAAAVFDQLSLWEGTTVDTTTGNRESVSGAGTLKWSFSTGDSVRSSPAISPDGTIYIGSGDKNLYALNPDGTLKWTGVTQGSVYTSPAIADDGTVYVASHDGNLYAFRPDGSQKWSYPTASPYSRQIQSSPAIGPDGTVYIGSVDENLYAVNPDGTLKWTFPAGYAIDSSPAIGADGTIYFGVFNIYGINSDGTFRASYSHGVFIRSSPAIGIDGSVYIGSWWCKLIALHPDVSLQWSLPCNPTEGNGAYSSPAIGQDGTIYVGAYDGKLYAVNPDGTIQWAFTVGDTIYYSSPAIDKNGTIYIGCTDGNLYAINPDGTSKWTLAVGGAIDSSPAIGPDGTIYIGSYNGNVYAINGDSGGLADTPWPMFHQNLLHTGRQVGDPPTAAIDMVSVPGGTFQMGWVGIAESVHTVTLTAFEIARHEVTYEMWYTVRIWAESNGYSFANPGSEGHDGTAGSTPTAAQYEPVTYLGWRDAITWCNALSEKEGLTPCYYKAGQTHTTENVYNNSLTGGDIGNTDVDWSANGYRLPTEAEWEYAARGGKESRGLRYAGSNSAADVGWYGENSGSKTHPVGQKIPNELGIYDMSGNVWEWCWDWYASDYYAESPGADPSGPSAGEYRVLRGGSWSFSAGYLRVANRLFDGPTYSGDGRGFRLARTGS